MTRLSGLARRLDRVGRRAEEILLVTLLTVLIALAGIEIIRRNLFGSGFIWADELLRLLVLWLTLAGALVAARDRNQINIDILSRWLPARTRQVVGVIVDLFTAGVCGLLCWHAARFVQAEWEYGTTLLGGAPAWALQSILPLGFGLLTWRYLANAFGCRSHPPGAPA